MISIACCCWLANIIDAFVFMMSIIYHHHYSEHDCVSNHLHIDLFAQPFVQAQIKENIKAPRHWLCEENLPVTSGVPSQRASNRKMFPHDDIIMINLCSFICNRSLKWSCICPCGRLQMFWRLGICMASAHAWHASVTPACDEYQLYIRWM